MKEFAYYASEVNLIAITALQDFGKDIKNHPDYGWIIVNNAGEDDYNPNRHDVYYKPGSGYSFADAVMIAANNKYAQPNNDIWIEPSNHFKEVEWDELCIWIIQNNLERNDPTTIENVSAGRKNTVYGGIAKNIYDKEYKEWVETTL